MTEDWPPPAAGEPLAAWLERMIVTHWRGADEEPRELPADCDQVRCVCATVFRFAPGQLKARCPGCRARYWRQAPKDKQSAT